MSFLRVNFLTSITYTMKYPTFLTMATGDLVLPHFGYTWFTVQITLSDIDINLSLIVILWQRNTLFSLEGKDEIIRLDRRIGSRSLILLQK
jgi:hypothetical protein